MQIRRASCCVCGRGLQGRVEPVDRARQVHNPRSFTGPIRSENRSKPELTVLTKGGPRKEFQLANKRKNTYGYQPSCVWIPTNQMPQTGRGDRASSAATFCWLTAMDLSKIPLVSGCIGCIDNADPMKLIRVHSGAGGRGGAPWVGLEPSVKIK